LPLAALEEEVLFAEFVEEARHQLVNLETDISMTELLTSSNVK
jgi:hypothetical protein